MMLHELLLALNGHIGGLFIVDELQNIKVSRVSFLHPGEESLLNRLCEYGTYYMKFQKFLRAHIDFNKSSDIAPGLYMNALCYCLQDDILSDYEGCIVDLEAEIMMDCNTSLTHIQCKLHGYTLLFPSILQLLNEIESRKSRGCQLLGLVDKYCTTGIPAVQTAMKIIKFSLHKVMFKQLSTWLMYGVLMDSYAEFFVHKVKKIKSLAAAAANQDDEIGIGGITGQQLQKIQGNEDGAENDDTRYFEQFSLRGEMLPPYLPIRVLHKIVFIGESVDMFEHDNGTDVIKSIMKHRIKEFSKDLYNLSLVREFRAVDLENIVDKIRSCVAERLWEYVVSESQLLDELQKIKDMFLLGRGDLYQSLIDSADTLLCCPPSSMTTLDANRVFQQIIRSLNLSDERLQRFRLIVEPSAKGSTATKTKQNGWTILSVQYKAQWPLHVFFSTVALERYNAIFKFLLAVKRVHVALHKAWKQQMYKWDKRGEDQPLLHQIRNHMQFLVDNLQTYLQVDVIESQYQEMLQRINNSKDFEIIRSAHETFQTNLLSQCFLLNVPVNHCLMCILESCTSFCTLLNSCDGGVSVDQLDHCQALQVMFQKQTLLLFKILTSTKTHQRNPYLVQLLLRIDFNKYFSSAGQQLG